MRVLSVLLLLASACATIAATPPQIRFCPAAQVRAYPLDTQHDANALVLQNLIVANTAAAPLHVRAITIELLSHDRVVDQRRLDGATLDAAGALGKRFDANNVLAAEPFQFCDRALVHAGEHLGGPALARNDALLVMSQVFGYTGPRDTLRVTVDTDTETAAASTTLPIRSELAHKPYRFPLRGTWYVGNGPSFHTDHRWGVMEEFAFDLAKLGASGTTHAGDGTAFADYYAYGSEVLAAGDGRVARVHDGEPEDPTAMQRPGESQADYMTRLRSEQGARLAKGLDAIAGNYVIIDHGDQQYSLYAHLQPASISVEVGDAVRAGQPIAKLGSSGNSTEPHLHFQLCDRPEPLACAGIPIQFENAEVLWSDAPRPIQSGDVVDAK